MSAMSRRRGTWQLALGTVSGAVLCSLCVLVIGCGQPELPTVTLPRGEIMRAADRANAAGKQEAEVVPTDQDTGQTAHLDVVLHMYSAFVAVPTDTEYATVSKGAIYT